MVTRKDFEEYRDDCETRLRSFRKRCIFIAVFTSGLVTLFLAWGIQTEISRDQVTDARAGCNRALADRVVLMNALRVAAALDETSEYAREAYADAAKEIEKRVVGFSCERVYRLPSRIPLIEGD